MAVLWSLDLATWAVPLADADAIVGASELGVVVDRTHVVGEGPAGGNVYRWTFLYDAAQDNSGASYGGEFYLGWQKDTGAAPIIGQSRFSRIYFKISDDSNFRAINSANGDDSQIIHKLWILADGGSTRTIVSVHGNVGSGTFNLHVGLNGGGEIQINSLQRGEWYALQVETVTGTGTGALRAWLNTDVSGTPTAQATGLTISPALYDGVSLGFYNNRMLASDGIYEIDFAGFEYADDFDAAWFADMAVGEGSPAGSPASGSPDGSPGSPGGGGGEGGENVPMMQPLMGIASSIGTSSSGILLDHSTNVTAGFPGITRCPWPLAGTFRNLVVRLDTLPGGSATRTFTLEVNGASTAMAVTLGAGDLTGRYIATNITIAAGDLVRLVAASTNTPATAAAAWSLEFWPDTPKASGYTTNLGTTSTGYVSPFTGETNATETAVASVMPCSGTITGLVAVNTSDTLNSGDHLVFDVYKNGVKQDGTGGTVDTTLDLTNVAIDTAVSASFSLTVARGDTVSLGLTPTSYPASWTGIALAFLADTNGYSILAGTGSSNPSATGTTANYGPLHTYSSTWSGSIAFANRLIAGVSPFSLRDLYLVVDTSPGAAPNSRTFTVMKNGAATDITGVVTDGALTIDDDAIVTFEDEDQVGPMRHVPFDTPTVTGDEQWALVIHDTIASAAPTSYDDSYTTPYETQLVVAAAGVLANDDTNGGGTMTATLVDDVGTGTLILSSDGSFTYDPPAAFVGSTTFTYRAVNSIGTGTLATVTIIVLSGGGGTGGTGTNPATGLVPTGVLRPFFELQLNTSPTTRVMAAETMLRDATTWYGGKKPGRLISISEIERELSSDGSFRGSEVKVVVGDTDRTYRTLAATTTLSGTYAAIYLVDDETRYAEGEPYRIFAGKVYTHRALPGFQYEFLIRDVLSDRIADLDASPRVPPTQLSVADFPGMDAKYEGRAAPIVLGYASDEAETGNIAQTPQGVIPPVVLGRVNFTYWGGIDQDAIACIWSHGALVANGLETIYYNPPETPDTRIEIPDASYGVDVWTPGKPGWADTGLATDYVDYPLPLSAATRRYTPFFVNADHPLASSFEEGRVLVAANMYGVAENGDGTGDYLSDAPRIWQWLIVNQLFEPYTTGDYAALPALDGVYSIIDTDTVEASVTRLRGFLGGSPDSYAVGFLLGRGGQQATLRHILGELCAGVQMDQGINRHGQLMVDVEDPAAAATVSLSDLLDIEDGEFEAWVDHAAYRNRIEYVHGYRYLPPSAPTATPAAGEALPTRPLKPYYEWTSGLQAVESAAGIAAVGATRTLHVENYVVRDAAVAAHVMSRMLTRLVGPSPSYDGPRLFRLTTSWQGLGAGGSPDTVVELGTVIAITHLEGLGASGYDGIRGRVTKIRIDPQKARVTLEGRILGA